MFDAHTHLNSDQLYSDRKQHAYDFIDAWWTHLVSVWIDTVHNQRNIAIATQRLEDERSPECVVKSTIGIHPCSVWETEYTSKESINKQIALIQSQFENYTQHLVAVWECWIDAHRWDYQAIKKLQWYAFEQQCLLAQKLNLPIVIHSRSQRPDTLAILRAFTDLRIYLHCWGYTPSEVEQANKELPNLRIWFCGNTTYPKAQSLKDSLITARDIQSQWGCKVVIETDAPYLAPQSHRGKQNVPKYLLESGNAFAQILEISPEGLFDTTNKNTRKLYGLS
jgi:TatD DNase family protein